MQYLLSASCKLGCILVCLLGSFSLPAQPGYYLGPSLSIQTTSYVKVLDEQVNKHRYSFFIYKGIIKIHDFETNLDKTYETVMLDSSGLTARKLYYESYGLDVENDLRWNHRDTSIVSYLFTYTEKNGTLLSIRETKLPGDKLNPKLKTYFTETGNDLMNGGYVSLKYRRGTGVSPAADSVAMILTSATSLDRMAAAFAKMYTLSADTTFSQDKEEIIYEYKKEDWSTILMSRDEYTKKLVSILIILDQKTANHIGQASYVSRFTPALMHGLNGWANRKADLFFSMQADPEFGIIEVTHAAPIKL